MAVAEKLFAECGIDGVSLNEVTRASAQRNKSALTYHFGSKEGLMLAIIDKHAPGIIEKRNKLLQEVLDSGDVTLEKIIRAAIEPVIQKLDDKDGGVYFLKIVAQLASNKSNFSLFEERPEYLSSDDALMRALRDLTADMPEDLRMMRMMQAFSMLFHTLVYIADVTAKKRKGKNARLKQLFIDNLIDSLMAIATLEPSAATRQQLALAG
ncbi:MAG: helix-turn-helix transcriptional regulator [Pseudomonadales bacterium]|nr:helix-turn-helix transcriptional regulator [Pseudomonadales bacterium]